MGERHLSVETYSLNEYAQMQHEIHRNALLEHHKQGRIVLPDNFEELLHNWTFDEYYFLQPVPARQRRVLLYEAGVSSIDPAERDECRIIRASRVRCGCACRLTCDTRTCSCYRAGIRCQVDQMSFPCGCTGNGCSNSFGRIEFDAARVKAHFAKTLMHMELENTLVTDSDNRFHMEQSIYGDSTITPKRCATEEDNAKDVKRLRLDKDPSMEQLRTEAVSGGLSSHVYFSREIPDCLIEINSQSFSNAVSKIANRSSCNIPDDIEIPVIVSKNFVNHLSVVNSETSTSSDYVPLDFVCDIRKPSVFLDRCDDVGDNLQQLSCEIVSQMPPNDYSVCSKKHSIITRHWKSSSLSSFVKNSMSSTKTSAVSKCTILIDQSSFDPVASLARSPEKCASWKVNQSSDVSVPHDNCHQMLAESYVVCIDEPAHSSELAFYSELACGLSSRCHLSSLNEVKFKSQLYADNSIARSIYRTANCSSSSESPKELHTTIEEQRCSQLTKKLLISKNVLSESRPISISKQSRVYTILQSEQLESDAGLNEESSVVGSRDNCVPLASSVQLNHEKSSDSACYDVEEDSECCLHAAPKS